MKKKTSRDKPERSHTHPLSTACQKLFSLREDLCGSGSLLKVIVSAYVHVKEKLPLKSINSQLTIY